MRAVVQGDRLLNIFAIWGMKKPRGYKMQAQYFSSVLPERSAISLRLHRLGQPFVPEIAVVRLLNISVWGIKKTPNFTSGYFDRLSFERKLTSESSIENQERIHLSEPSISFYRETRVNLLFDSTRANTFE